MLFCLTNQKKSIPFKEPHHSDLSPAIVKALILEYREQLDVACNVGPFGIEVENIVLELKCMQIFEDGLLLVYFPDSESKDDECRDFVPP